jgi:hypothetical protein
MHGSAAMWPLATRAQPKAMPRRGVIVEPIRRKAFEQGFGPGARRSFHREQMTSYRPRV